MAYNSSVYKHILLLIIIFIINTNGVYNIDVGEGAVKVVSPVPRHQLLLRRLLQYNSRPYNMCSNRDKERMQQCDTYAADDWDISEVPQL
ncbi:unnamed protein product [Oppiella nova]|uniref:Uncharacterized protein n=1 Tax=Oppiella nova TaxID=334625 RepID=A0A7R9MEU2_9ACAR|nr:unnamed protein product [Oppiella nova]CAG2174859.1 unnamed protein product [Oppiella nova]